MSAVIELNQAERVDLRASAGIAGLEGISFLVQPSEAIALIATDVPALDFSNVIGLIGTAPATSYLVDDLALGELSRGERDAACTLLRQLRRSLNATSALACDMLSSSELTAIENVRLLAN